MAVVKLQTQVLKLFNALMSEGRALGRDYRLVCDRQYSYRLSAPTTAFKLYVKKMNTNEKWKYFDDTFSAQSCLERIVKELDRKDKEE